MSGSALVVLATLDHPDREGDLIVSGALANDRAVVSSAEHAVFLGKEEPVGEARLFEKDGRLWGEVTYDSGARPAAACDRVNGMRPAWSVGYRVLKHRAPTPQEAARGTQRVILAWEILEISPVREPAGAGVGTLEASCA